MPKKADGKLFLLQRYDNGDFCIYHWTPFLAKKGYKTLTKEEAAPFHKLSSMGKSNMKYIESESVRKSVEGARVEGEALDDNKTDNIVEDVVSNHVVKEDDTIEDSHKLTVSQEDIFDMESAYIKGLVHKSSLEKHMLEKYQCDIPVGRLSSMKSIAYSMLEDLAGTHRLYLIAGKIKMQ